MPARRDEDRSPATTPRNSVETPPPRNWARELARPPQTPRSASAPAIPPVTPTGKVKKARQKLRNLVRKHLDRIRAKTARSPRNSRDSDSDEDCSESAETEDAEFAFTLIAQITRTQSEQKHTNHAWSASIKHMIGPGVVLSLRRGGATPAPTASKLYVPMIGAFDSMVAQGALRKLFV